MMGSHDRAVIVHADDIGMCHATIAAFADLIDVGFVTSASLMVPCAWFATAAALCRTLPAADIGVHLTHTAEWELYRWAPLTPAPTLRDAEGCFPRSTAVLWAQADPAEMLAESRAQIERVLAAGIDVTHLDSHMGAVFHPAYLAGYLALAEEFALPALLPRSSAESLLKLGITGAAADQILAQQAALAARGLPIIEHVTGMPLDRHEDRAATIHETFAALPPGISYLILHPAADTAELRAIASNDYRGRAADLAAFADRQLRDAADAHGVRRIGWRAIRDAMRAGR